MPRRRGRGRRGKAVPPRVVPFDFYGIMKSTTKLVNHSDVGLLGTRAYRIHSYSVQIVCTMSGDYPTTVSIATYNSQASDLVHISRPQLVSKNIPRIIRGKIPSFIDYGDIQGTDPTRAPLLLITQQWSEGPVPTVTFSGTIWIQFAPHKVPTKVARALALEAVRAQQSEGQGSTTASTPSDILCDDDTMPSTVMQYI